MRVLKGSNANERQTSFGSILLQRLPCFPFTSLNIWEERMNFCLASESSPRQTGPSLRTETQHIVLEKCIRQDGWLASRLLQGTKAIQTAEGPVTGFSRASSGWLFWTYSLLDPKGSLHAGHLWSSNTTSLHEWLEKVSAQMQILNPKVWADYVFLTSSPNNGNVNSPMATFLFPHK